MEGIEKYEVPKNVYEDPNFVTLYRYENPAVTYDETRDGVVSKQDIVGQWYTDNLGDLKTYIKARKPGGRLVAIRVPSSDLGSYDATKLEKTKDMDIESGNFVVPPDIAQSSRLEMLLTIETANSNKFLFGDWQKINKFVDENLSAESLVDKAKSQQ
jgi:hypothetical protein